MIPPAATLPSLGSALSAARQGLGKAADQLADAAQRIGAPGVAPFTGAAEDGRLAGMQAMPDRAAAMLDFLAARRAYAASAKVFEAAAQLEAPGPARRD